MNRILPLGLALAALLTAAPSARAQVEEELLARYEEKVSQKFVSKFAWLTSYAEAREKAKSRGKLILAYFTRSDEPCCEHVEQGELLEEPWKERAKDFVLYVHVTTGLETRPDERLFVEKGCSIYPCFALLDPGTGAVLDSMTFQSRTFRRWWSGGALERAKERAKELKKLQAKLKARSYDPKLQAALKLKLAVMYAGETPMPELLEAARVEGVDPAVKAEFEAWYPQRRLQLAQHAAEAKAKTPEEEPALLRTAYYELFKEGLRIPAEHKAAIDFASTALLGAIEQRDLAVAEVALAEYERALQQPAFPPEMREGLVKLMRAAMKQIEDPPGDG